jgi:large subunit ribosomal protein L5
MFKISLIKKTFLPNLENTSYNYNLDYITKFNLINIFSKTLCTKITLNFGFKDIKFDKKQMILHFFLLELLSNQKCVLTTSRKNIIALKIKKGAVTGCKVTLRNASLASFLDTLILGLPRSEIFKGFSFKKSTYKHNTFSTKINNLFMFYTLESEITQFITTMDISFNFNTTNDLEKRFFFTYQKIPLNFFN